MAHCLAQTLLECLKIRWRHRKIRASNILFFLEDVETAVDRDVENPFLCGFEESQLKDDYSLSAYGFDKITYNVYCHPQRWGAPTENFNAYHDLYSFGVVLLEICLWEPILSVLERYSGIGKKDFEKITPKNAKASLLAACRKELRFKCGSRVERMVTTCLNSDFGVDEAVDTKLQTNAQLMFRQDILNGLVEARRALAA